MAAMFTIMAFLHKKEVLKLYNVQKSTGHPSSVLQVPGHYPAAPVQSAPMYVPFGPFILNFTNATPANCVWLLF